MSRLTLLTMLYATGCCGLGLSPMPQTPAAPGSYHCASGATFTVDAQGVWDNGDNMGCRTGVAGGRLELDCHGWRQSAAWQVQPDGSVRTDVVPVVYGEGVSQLDSCTRSAR